MAEQSSSFFDRIHKTLFLIALCVLMVVYGLVAYKYSLFPASFFEKATYSIEQELLLRSSRVRERLAGEEDFYVWSGLWRPAPAATKTGVTRHDPEKTWPGYTLYTSGDDERAVLIDMDGRIVHEWSLDFRDVWPRDKWLSGWENVQEDYVYFRDALLMPNGDLIVVVTGFGARPWGLGLLRLNSRSEVNWDYPRRVHHKVSLTPEGNLLTLAHELHPLESIKAATGWEHPTVEDFVVLVSPDGEEIARHSLHAMLFRDGYIHMAHPRERANPEDLIHSNSINPVTAEFASHHSWAEPGQALVVLRNFNAVAQIDMEEGKITWMQRLPGEGPHDVDPLPNGNLLFFDNLGHLGDENRSRVVEYNPTTGKLVRIYDGTDEDPLWSHLRSQQHLLPNGNLLITESDAGRIIEVTPNDETVWEYFNPERMQQKGQEYIAIVSAARRVDPESLNFDLNQGNVPARKTPTD